MKHPCSSAFIRGEFLQISMTETITGWLFDLYPNETNLTVWLIGEDGRRQRFVQDFTAVLYAAGPATRLRAALEVA